MGTSDTEHDDNGKATRYEDDASIQDMNLNNFFEEDSDFDLPLSINMENISQEVESTAVDYSNTNPGFHVHNEDGEQVALFFLFRIN